MSDRVFVFGVEGKLTVRTDPPREVRGESRSFDSIKTTPWVRYGWPAGASWMLAKGSLVAESKTLEGQVIYFRVLPPDVLPALAEIDAEIVATEALLHRQRADRQALLAAAVLRGSRVRVADCVPAVGPSEPAIKVG